METMKDIVCRVGIKGSGFDVKLGAIIRPFEYSPFRVGLAIHTPIFYSLDYKTSAQVISDVMDVVTGEIKGYDVRSWDNLPGKGDMILPFDFQTPWTYNVSLGYTVGKSLALGAEYEYQDYSSMKFKDTEGNSSAYEFENSTTSMLKGVSTVRLGLEYKVILGQDIIIVLRLSIKMLSKIWLLTLFRQIQTLPILNQ